MRTMCGVERSQDSFDGVKYAVQHEGKVYPNYTISGEERKECMHK